MKLQTTDKLDEFESFSYKIEIGIELVDFHCRKCIKELKEIGNLSLDLMLRNRLKRLFIRFWSQLP